MTQEAVAYIGASAQVDLSWLLTPSNLNSESVFTCHINASSHIQQWNTLQSSELFII